MCDHIITASDVSMSYPKPHGLSLKNFYKLGSNKDNIANIGPFSLNIKKGDRIGVIGANGAGKTTLLRVLAGIYPPSSGIIRINGQVSAVIDSGLGFEPFASARENIRMRCYLDGITRQCEVREIIEEIEAFVELGEKFDYPIYTYSTGMFFRLAFAYATRKAKSVAIIDELIGSGDLSFAHKAEKRLENFFRFSSTLILSSHSMELISNYCTSCLYVKRGRVYYFENIAECVEQYKSDSING